MTLARRPAPAGRVGLLVKAAVGLALAVGCAGAPDGKEPSRSSRAPAAAASASAAPAAAPVLADAGVEPAAPAPAVAAPAPQSQPEEVVVVQGGGDVAYPTGWPGERECEAKGSGLFDDIRPLLDEGD